MEKLFGLIGEKLGHTYSPIINSKIMEEIYRQPLRYALHLAGY